MSDPRNKGVPGWVVLHVPHDSVLIPAEVRDQFVLSDAGLQHELVQMTDWHTRDLFATGIPAEQVVRAPVSRLVVDVERFESDEAEPMSARGMGAIYTRTHDGSALRRELSKVERQMMLERWYRPHHQALTDAVDRALVCHGRALVIDAHSFPSRALPYEANPHALRPQMCIGTDAFHTPKVLAEAFMASFAAAGFETALDTPFAGALVPMQHYRKDARVSAVMIEVGDVSENGK